MGRKTYEPVVKAGKPFPAYPGVKNYLVSRTLDAVPVKNVELIKEEVAEFVGRLKSEKGLDIFIQGGGELASPLFEAGLIDEVGMTIHPVLLGSGVPLFDRMSCQIDLELVECRAFKNGCVLVKYKVRS